MVDDCMSYCFNERIYKIEDLLSWKEGSDIIIFFTNGLILEYDKISDPNVYIKELLFKYEICRDTDEIDAIRSNISEIKIKRHNLDKRYTSVWNNKTSKELPYNNSLIRFNINIYQNYISLFVKNKEFAKKYLSMHFDFNYRFINDYWEYLDLGDAYYTAFIIDTDGVYYSSFGLSYNNNIRWNSKLKAKYEYGLFNPFEGEYIGTENYHTSVDDIDYMDIMIPLSPEKEIERREEARSTFYEYYPEMIDTDKDIIHMQFIDNIFQEYQFLDFNEFKKIFNESKLKVLVNNSIWEKTLKHVLDKDFVYAFFNIIKEEKNKK